MSRVRFAVKLVRSSPYGEIHRARSIGANDGLASILAHNSVGGPGGGRAPGFGPDHCLLDRLLALALEVSGRGRGRAADRSATYRSRLLRSGGSWPAQPPGTILAIPDRTHLGFYFHRPG